MPSYWTTLAQVMVRCLMAYNLTEFWLNHPWTFVSSCHDPHQATTSQIIEARSLYTMYMATGTWTTLGRVMVCCLMAPANYLFSLETPSMDIYVTHLMACTGALRTFWGLVAAYGDRNLDHLTQIITCLMSSSNYYLIWCWLWRIRYVKIIIGSDNNSLMPLRIRQ